jgi:hypothetical protein
VSTEKDLERLREKVEIALHALTPVIPISGTWTSGYSVPDHINPTQNATVEQWANAAYVLAELHAEITGIIA